MDYLEDNLAVMKQERPFLYEKIQEKIEEATYSFENMECVEARDGNQVLCLTKKDKTYRLNSLYRPIQEAEKWADQYSFQDMNITVMMYGIGSGIFAREMLRRLDTDAKVFLYEPDLQLYLFCIQHFDMTDMLRDTRVQLFIQDINTHEFEASIDEVVHWTNLPSQIRCSHPMMDKIYMEEYVPFLAAVESTNKMAKVNRDTESALAHQAVSNIIKNLHFIKGSNYIADLTEDIPEGVPAIIVAAGPSLDKNIDELKKAEGKAFILATDTSVKYLLAHDIKFDAMITIDARKSIWHLQDERCADVPFFCIIEAKNELLEMNKGHKIWFRGNNYMYKIYREFGREFPSYNSGGSVATGAFSTCVALGFKQIVLIGQDLAYAGDVTHAGGVTTKILNENYGIKMVEGVNGDQVKSRYDWLIYKDWFEGSIKTLSDIEVIDATEGGALIKGSKVMKLSETINQYCKKDFDFGEILSRKEPTFDDEEYNKIKEILYHLEKEFDNIKQKATEGKKAGDELIQMVKAGRNQPKKEEKNLKIVRKANNFINKQRAYDLLDLYIMSSIRDKMQGINQLTDNADDNFVQTIEISNAVYKAMIEAVDTLKSLVKEELAKL